MKACLRRWWVPGLQAAAVVLSLGYGIVAASGDVSARPAAPPLDVEELYRSDCAVCHGADGTGTSRGPTLASVGEASLDYQLSTGRMPLAGRGRIPEPGRPVAPLPNQQLGDLDENPSRLEPAYSPATIEALVGYVSTLTGGGGPPIPRLGAGDIAKGGEQFRLQCAACHAWAGEGGALLDREAPALHQATPVQIAEATRVGPGQMPAFGEAALDDDDLDDVVAYVRYLDAPEDRGGAALAHAGPVAEGAVAMLGVVLLGLVLRWIGQRG